MGEAENKAEKQGGAGRKRSRWMLAVLLALGLLFGFVAFYLYLLMRVPRLAEEWEAEARAELEALLGPPVPDDQNAAVLYREAAAAFVEANAGRTHINASPLAHSLHHVRAEHEKEARGHVERIAEALRLVEEAQRKPQCWWEYTLEFESLPPISELRELARILSLRAWLASLDGEPDAAITDVQAALRLSDDIPPRWGHVWSAVRSDVFWVGLYRVLELSRPSERALCHLLAVLNGTAPLYEEYKLEMVRYQRIWVNKTWADLARMRHERYGAEKEADFTYVMIYRPFFLAFDRSAHLREMERLSELLRLPPGEALQAAESLEAWRRNPSRWQRLTRRTTCSWTVKQSRFWSVVHTDTQLALCRAAVACEIHEREHGVYPDSLDALVPGILKEVPVDPFDGAPVRYRRSGKHLVFWSVGTDQKDGGGVQNDSRGLPDVVLELHAPGPAAPAPQAAPEGATGLDD